MTYILQANIGHTVWVCSRVPFLKCVCVCVCVVQGSPEETQAMIPQSSTPRLRRCGYCLLQVSSDLLPPADLCATTTFISDLINLLFLNLPLLSVCRRIECGLLCSNSESVVPLQSDNVFTSHSTVLVALWL